MDIAISELEVCANENDLNYHFNGKFFFVKSEPLGGKAVFEKTSLGRVKPCDVQSLKDELWSMDELIKEATDMKKFLEKVIHETQQK